MRLTSFVRAAITSAILLVVVVGCRRQDMPATFDAEAAAKAAAEVLAATDEQVTRLTAGELNTIFQNRHDGAWKRDAGKICEVSGNVHAVTIVEKQADNPHESIRVWVYVPEYAAASVECYFDMEHKATAQQLKAGDPVTIRGKLTGGGLHIVRENVIDLIGCTIAPDNP